jgi:serine/threonine protein kinase
LGQSIRAGFLCRRSRLVNAHADLCDHTCAVTCPRCNNPLPAPPGECAVCAQDRERALQRRRRDPLIGVEIAGRFLVQGVIGQGGMGKVYRARHLALHKDICLKVLKPALLEDPTLVGRFEREAQAASRLNHPNAIQVLDFGRVSEEGTLYIAMELVQGKDLRQILQDHGPLNEERIIRVVAQVLAALSEAHTRNVIHRDLKPENIMVEQRDEHPDFVKVLDFGIAKILDSDLPGLTRADVVCGTPQYMAPEQATGSELDARCDLYAVGIILYQLATGTLPFEGTNAMEILTAQVNNLPQPPLKRLPAAKIGVAMERLILRALEKDPNARPQSALEFRKLLIEIPQLANRTPHSVATLPNGPKARATGRQLEPLLSEESLAALRGPRWRTPVIVATIAAGLAVAWALGAHGWHANDLGGETVAAPIIGTQTNSLAAAKKSSDAAALVEQAHQLQRDGDTGAARDLLERAVALDPDNARAHYSLGGLYLYTQPERARREYDLSVKLDAKTYAAQVKAIEATLPPPRK